ncbi:hypothetical protein DFJ77DRAFT_438897 [Powellomyces hirtus]|nr:hypothetical protein DFJ77DRAFT_438897 [Powellomyces hirtus]
MSSNGQSSHVMDMFPALLDQYARMGINPSEHNNHTGTSNPDPVPSLIDQCSRLALSAPTDTNGASSSHPFPTPLHYDTFPISSALHSNNHSSSSSSGPLTRPRSSPVRRNTAYEIIFVDEGRPRSRGGSSGKGKCRSRSVDSNERALIRPYSPRPIATHGATLHHIRSWVISPKVTSPRALGIDKDRTVPIFQVRRPKHRHSPYAFHRIPPAAAARRSKAAGDPCNLPPAPSSDNSGSNSMALITHPGHPFHGLPLSIPERLYLRQMKGRSFKELPAASSGKVTELDEHHQPLQHSSSTAGNANAADSEDLNRTESVTEMEMTSDGDVVEQAEEADLGFMLQRVLSLDDVYDG